MNRIGLTLFTAAMVAASAAAQTQSGAQGGAQSSAQASADASKQGAEASGSGSATASGAAQVGQNSNSTSLAGGSTFNAVLRAPLDSKKCKPGDAVNARTTEPAKSDGKTVFPKGTKLVGHVTQASARGKGDSESALGIVFDKAILKNGEEVPVNVAIQAIASAETGARAAGSDIDTMGGLGTSTAGSGTAGGRGALGGVTSAAGGTAGTVTNTAANAGGTTRGLDAAGQLASNSQGVFGLNGLNLSSATSNSTQGSLITSAGKNVHLDSGTQMLLVSQAESAPQGESKQPKSDKSLPKSQSQSRSDKPNQK
jgi:hypothetical protein